MFDDLVREIAAGRRGRLAKYTAAAPRPPKVIVASTGTVRIVRVGRESLLGEKGAELERAAGCRDREERLKGRTGSLVNLWLGLIYYTLKRPDSPGGISRAPFFANQQNSPTWPRQASFPAALAPGRRGSSP